MKRTESCLNKLACMNDWLNHIEGDRVPVGGSSRCCDLGWAVPLVKADPLLKPCGIDTIEKALEWGFDASQASLGPEHADKNGFEAMIATVAVVPSWMETVRSRYPYSPVFGEVREAYELGRGILGSKNMLMWLALYPDEMGVFLDRVTTYILDLCTAQIEAAGGMLDGFVVRGAVAYENGLLFPPETWRRYFLPCIKAIIDHCHAHRLPVMYYGDGNVSEILADLIDAGLDGYGPVGGDTGMDVIKTQRYYGHELAFIDELIQ